MGTETEKSIGKDLCYMNTLLQNTLIQLGTKVDKHSHNSKKGKAHSDML